MANKIGEGWGGQGKKVFREFTVDGQTVHAEMVSLPPGDGLAVTGTVTANPPTVTLTTVSNTCASAGANTGAAAPAAGNHYVLHSIQLQLEAAATSLQRVLLKSDTTEMFRFVGTAVGDGIVIIFPPGQELHWGSAKAIVLDLAEAKAIGYVLRYRTIAD